MILNIHHIAIICSNYTRSKAFYLDVLGCEVIRETYRQERCSYKLDLRVGDHGYIELFSFPNPPKRLSFPEACGLRHIAFAVADIDAAHSEIQKKGVEVEAIRYDELADKHFFLFPRP